MKIVLIIAVVILIMGICFVEANIHKKLDEIRQRKPMNGNEYEEMTVPVKQIKKLIPVLAILFALAVIAGCFLLDLFLKNNS